VRAVELFHQDRKVQSRWPAPDNGYFHYALVWTALRGRPRSFKAPQLWNTLAATEGRPAMLTEVLSRMHSPLRQSHL
jgi:hypothetical protein